MCGISGQIDFRGRSDQAAVAAMTGRLRHRGPDDSGIWSSPGGECILGHARLSVVDLSPLGHQPMHDSLTGNIIVFNGEIYNFQQLRAVCEHKGDRFVSHSDTEVILAMYRRHGVECLKQLRGMFAFAIWDNSAQRLFIARDRVGKKPLNYCLIPGGIIFASELTALSAHPAVATDLDDDALELYLQLAFIPSPWTIYRSVRKLPPAHFALFSKDGLRVEQYWDVDYRVKMNLSEQEALDGLEEKLREAVRLRMIADVPIGALLSGGVDSSVIVALMSGLSGKPIKTFSIGFAEEKFNELHYAAQIAEKYHTDHRPKIVSGQVAPLLDSIVRHYGEPFADSSAVPSFHVCRTARQHVTVAMNGDGGDELLGGYPRYRLPSWGIAIGRIMGNSCSAEKLARMVVGLEQANSPFKRLRRKWLLEYSHPEMYSHLLYAAYWNDAERAELLGRNSEFSPLLHAWRSDWLEQVRNRANNPIDRLLWIDNRIYLPGDLLVKMDIASMHCGLETRSPLLDHEVIEYCAALPVHLKVKNRHGKYLLKKLAERYLPHDLIYRRKMGFGIPLADWLRGSLKTTLEDIIYSPDLMDRFDMRVIRRTMDEFNKNEIDHSSRLWALFMFGLWRQQQDARSN